MRKISLFVLLFSFITVFSTPLSAAGANSSTPPPKDGVCISLKAKAITKGLFGLCVAYCEAGANSQRVLDNYNRKKKGSDPAMPCLEVTEPTLSCACWSTLTEADIGAGVDVAPLGCATYQPTDFIFYGSTGNSELLMASDGACGHFNSATGVDVSMPFTQDGQEEQCRAEILKLAKRDFGEFVCTPP